MWVVVLPPPWPEDSSTHGREGPPAPFGLLARLRWAFISSAVLEPGSTPSDPGSWGLRRGLSSVHQASRVSSLQEMDREIPQPRDQQSQLSVMNCHVYTTHMHTVGPHTGGAVVWVCMSEAWSSVWPYEKRPHGEVLGLTEGMPLKELEDPSPSGFLSRNVISHSCCLPWGPCQSWRCAV